MMCFILFLRIFLSALAGADGAERKAAIDSLVASGDVAWIANAVYDVGWRERGGLIDALEKIGADAVPGLVSIARTHPKNDAQRLAIRSLGYVGISARDSLREMIGSVHRDLVVEALGRVGDARDVLLVRPLLFDVHYDMRRRAALALVQLSGDKAAEDLCLLLSDAHHGTRFAGAGALVTLGEAGGRAVLARYDELSDSGKFLAHGIFGQLKYAPARDLVLETLHHNDWGLRSAAVTALDAFGDVASALALRLEIEPHPLVRTQLQNSLLD